VASQVWTPSTQLSQWPQGCSSFVEIGQQRLAAAAGFFAQRQHGVELVLLDALVALVAFGVLQHLLEHHHVLQAVGHPGIRRQAVTAGRPVSW
jgi:hypothetical protein